jgi:hypothetical protein
LQEKPAEKEEEQELEQVKITPVARVLMKEQVFRLTM